MHNLQKYLNLLKIVKSIYFNRITSLYFSLKIIKIKECIKDQAKN